MNLPVTEQAEAAFNKLKQNKAVATEVTPWWIVLEVKGESVDVAHQWPAPGAEKPSVTPENWKTTVWDEVVNHVTSNYAKGACFVVTEVCWTNSEGNFMSQPIFFKWCPDSGVPVKTKMMIGSAFQPTKRKLDVQGTTPELSLASQLEVNKFAAEAKLKGWVNQ